MVLQYNRLSRLFAAAGIAATLAALGASGTGCATTTSQSASLPERKTYPVSTPSPAAYDAFNRGLSLAFAFNYGGAEKAFRQAAALDPNCAMAWWGVALVNGPHINFPAVPPDRAAKAWEAITNAQALADHATEKERALIAAQAKRYAENQPEDRRPLDEAYAAAMRDVANTYPDCAHVQTLFAESLMDLRPWDLWTDDGRPQPETPEIIATLERAMALDPWHVGANHLYIHTIEASHHPDRAEDAADRLRATQPILVTGSSHLIHMPSHIYARVGRWDDVASANGNAMVVDASYRKDNPRPGFFALYMMHNTHFYAYAAMMQGRRDDALRAAHDMVGSVPEDFLQDFAPVADGFMIFVPEVMMRFGMWEDILAYPEPAENLPYSRAMWRFTRAVALTALKRLDEAEQEREAFRAAAAKVPEEWAFGNNNAHDLLAVATNMLDGEMAAQYEDFDASVASLHKAIEVEDTLRYDEPPDWIQPVRHTLGAVLLRAGRYAEAESVYREDLATYPGNGWSLYGLARALRLQQKDAEATEVEAKFANAWSGADTKMHASCLCQPGV